MGASLKTQLQKVKQEEKKILEKIDETRARKRIECAACGKSHPIRSLDAIQAHGYVEPHGCTGGAYWVESELQFVCPKTEVVNRLLIWNHDVPWEERKLYENDPEQQFKRMYKGLFRKVTDTYSEKPEEWVNNEYVHKNRAKFGLVERRESKR